MSDIVDRLRVGFGPTDRSSILLSRSIETLRQAADEIERLRAERDRLRAALLAWLDADDAGDGQECINAIAHARRIVGEGAP